MLLSEILTEPLKQRLSFTMLHFCADCGKIYPLENGHAHFSGYTTTFNSTVPVHCNKGYEVEGDDHIRCLASGNWSRTSACKIKGLYVMDIPDEKSSSYQISLFFPKANPL